MTVQVLQFILDLIVAVSSLEFLFMPVIVLAALALICRLILRRYS